MNPAHLAVKHEAKAFQQILRDKCNTPFEEPWREIYIFVHLAPCHMKLVCSWVNRC